MRYLTFLPCLLLIACQPAETVHSFSGHVMGTSWSVKLVAQRADHGLGQGLQAALDDINDKMSTYQSDSELSRFNQLQEAGCLAVSADTRTVVAAALEISQQTGGAFDVTVGPLVNLWGFGPDFKPEQIPDEATLAALRADTGYQHLRIEGEQLCKDRGGIYVDLSAIAKGYGVDAAARYLQSQGIENFLVEVGGELYARGNKPGGEAWRIGIETPRADRREVFENTIVPLIDVGAATSGDYRNYFEQDGVRYSHTIDPRTGHPIRHTLASVTVLAPNSMLADAWATTFMVLGPEDGLKLAEELKFPVLMLVRTGEGFASHQSSAYTQYMAQSPEK